MRFYRPLLLTAFCLLAQVKGQDDAAAIDPPPACALPCLATLVPQFCGADPSCVCTNKELAVALEPCVLGACNITEAMSLQKYSAMSCNVQNDKSRQKEQLNMHYTLPALTSAFVATRIFIRVKLDVGLGADDWMMVAALMAYLSTVGTGLTMTLQGFGQHTFWLSIKEVSTALKFFYISELVYLLTITLTKLSLLLFFRRIFPSRQFRIGVWAMIGFVISSNFALTMALCFQCVPFHGNWTNWMYKVPPVKCIDTFTVVFIAAAFSIVHDMMILGMPIPLLWKLNLAWQKKANVSVMFSVGSFVILFSLLRLPSLKKLNTSSDPSYDQAPIAVWTNLEMAVGIICGCLPACRSLIGYLFPNFKMSIAANTANTPGYASRSRPNIKGDKRMESSNRTFMELDDLQGSEDELHNHRNIDTGSIVTQSSEVPIREKLVPTSGKGFGNRVRVDAGDLESQRLKAAGNGIVMTKTVEQSHHPF